MPLKQPSNMAKFLEKNTPASHGYSATSDQGPNVCETCRNISSSSLREKLSAPPYCWSSYWLVNRDISDDCGMVHLRNARNLKSSAETCTLCSLMAREFRQHYLWDRAKKDPWDCVKETPIFLGPRLDRGHRHNFPYSHEWCAKLDGMQVWIPIDDKDADPLGDGYIFFGIRFYTDEDSPHTFRDITSRLPIEYTGSSLAFSRLNTCITACQDGHAECMKTIAGATLNPNEKPAMPTRVIDIGPKGSSQSPRLIYTNSSSGDFVALSHCWGTNKPLLTTKDNLECHLEGIPWDRLPKTFQHAMEVTREIGLRYLWIDSLCIVQGDREEWLRESEKMGSVYENAYLVVAAADARDSTEGCFIEPARSPRLEIVKIPYVQPSGEPLGSLYASHWRDETFQDPDENKSLLSTRAWITQEWILARRIAFYTSKGIVWSCRTIRSPPSGVNEISHRSELSDWWSLIQAHSSRNLTYFTDRLISLDGIRTEVQKRDHTVYKFGMFEKDLQTQLLWQVCPESHAARPDQSPIPAPSWSWVSRTSSIQFFKDWSETGPYRDERDKVDCGDVFFEDDVVIITDGTVMKLDPADWDPTTERSRTNIFRPDSDTSTTESETNEQDEYQATKGLEITDHEEEHMSWYSDIEPDSSVDYYDSYPHILFDDGNIPSQDAGPLFAVYLTRKYLVWPHDKEVQYEQYFIVLEPRLEGPADTYTRVGAGWIANDVTKALRFQSQKKRRIRIV